MHIKIFQSFSGPCKYFLFVKFEYNISFKKIEGGPTILTNPCLMG